jgi:hypothetical protein
MSLQSLKVNKVKSYKVGKKNFFISLFIFLVAGYGLNAQNVKVSAKLDSNKILIGDQVKLKVQVSYPVKTTIVWPELKDSLTKNIEIVQKSKIDTLSNDASILTLGQTYTITSFDSGEFYFPQISFKYKTAKDTGYFDALTDSLLLSVNTVAVDTTKAIKDIKGPMSVPWTFEEMLPYIIGVIVLAAIIWFVFWYMRKRKKGEKLINILKPKKPAHDEALLALETLRNKKLWQNNKVKEYYTELTEIIRIYVEKRFGVLAMEMTTDEIITSIFPFNIQDNMKRKLKQMLVLADLVKFAKSNPLPNEHDLCLDIAFEFINETKPVEVAEQKTEEMNNQENKENVF